MDHQTTGTVLVSVPSSEIVCSVDCVLLLSSGRIVGSQAYKQPLKVDRFDIPDLAGSNDLLHFPMTGIIPIVEKYCSSA
jgi:hypothetical protein